MKAFVTNIKTLSAMLLAVVAMVACSSDDSIIEQSGNTTGKYTLTVKASKGLTPAPLPTTARASLLHGQRVML